MSEQKGCFQMNELPAPTMFTVIINGVTVEVFDDTKPSCIAPMTAGLDWLFAHGGASKDAVARLEQAGVRSIPIYKSELDVRGIEYFRAGSFEGGSE